VTIALRTPLDDEVPALTALLESHSRAAFGERELDEDELRHWFTLPDVWMQVAEQEGRLVGYADAVSRDDGTLVEVDVRTTDPDAAEALLSAVEAHARREAPGAVLRSYTQGEEPALAGVFERDGWVRVRHFFHMQIELADEPAEPVWPDGMTVRTFRPGEEERVYETHADAFADHWDFRRQSMEAWRHGGPDHPRFDPSLWWLAQDGGKLAGVALSRWHQSGDPSFGWVDVLGVRPPWRRRGLGLALLLQSFGEFGRRGATRVGLGVDAESTTGAVSLYERAGMQVVRRNDAYEKQA
jgi:mycothiol synthase